mgnify:CR=1 FL=1
MLLILMTAKNWAPPTSQQIQAIIDELGISIKKAAHMARIGDRTFKQWLDPDDIKAPSQAAWSIFEYEVRSMRMGYKNIDHLFEALESQYREH